MLKEKNIYILTYAWIEVKHRATLKEFKLSSRYEDFIRAA